MKQIRTSTKLGKVRLTAESSNVLNKASGLEFIWDNVADLFKASAERLEQQSFVYFIGEEDNGSIKIGVAKDPIKRLRSMQTGNPRRLRLEHALVGDRALEKQLHQIWEEYAIYSARQRGKHDANPNTEWFRPELRDSLFPILDDAQMEQIETLRDPLVSVEREGTTETWDPASFSNMASVALDAHVEHGIELRGRDQTWMLARHGIGYVNTFRQSYL